VIRDVIGSIRPLSALPSRLDARRILGFASRPRCWSLAGLNGCRGLLLS
jgi:hypothetical protein